MRPTLRTVLAFLVAVLLALPSMLLARHLGVDGWGLYAAAIPAAVIASLVDRDGFYGARREPPAGRR